MPPRSTSVILFRERPGLEVFLVLRSPNLAFFGSYHAFVGGRAEAADSDAPVFGGDLSAEDRESLGCGARELFEETGVLATTGDPPAETELRIWRQKLHESDDATAFFDELRARNLGIKPSDWIEATRLVTPRCSRIRFDTRFFFLRTEAEPEIQPGELESGRWWKPAEALEAWSRGELLIAPPALVVLRALEEHGNPDEAAAELRRISPEFEGSGLAISWTPGVDIVPLTSPPLPESIPTTTFIVGARRVFVIDPAPSGKAERDHLLKALEARRTRGDKLVAALLTHHHVDHVGALAAVEEKFGLPVWAHARTGELLERKLDRTLDDGDSIDLGDAPDGSSPWSLRCVFTPGHAQGHLAFFDERYRALIAGDLLSTLVSMYVGTPGGHLETYFQSLRRVRELDARILFPSHGVPTLRVDELIDRTLAHRARRVEQIAVALGEGGEVDDVAERVYGREVDERLRPLFERTTRAALDYLTERGRATRVAEDRYAPTSTEE